MTDEGEACYMQIFTIYHALRIEMAWWQAEAWCYKILHLIIIIIIICHYTWYIQYVILRKGFYGALSHMRLNLNRGSQHP